MHSFARHSRMAMLSMLVASVLGRRAEAVASAASIDAVADSAVRIEVSLEWPGHGSADFSGSGWTRECRADAAEWEIVVATAGHVLDIPALAREAFPDEAPPTTVRVAVVYRDGHHLQAGREKLFVDRVHDYGELHLHSDVPRTVLPACVAAGGREGMHLYSIASPGRLAYGFFQGYLISTDTSLIANAPQGAWLSSLPVAPGASGAPVLDDDGVVVATVVGYVEWSWGGGASVLGALPPEFPLALLSTQSEQPEEDVTFMDFLGGLIPFLKLGALGAGASLLYRVLPPPKSGSPHDLADVVTNVARQAVQAIEQANGDLAGVDKKQLATQTINTILSGLHVKPPPALVDIAIESAVGLLNQATPAGSDATSTTSVNALAAGLLGATAVAATPPQTTASTTPPSAAGSAGPTA